MNPVSEPITIRAHNLICLQGFEGKGYSPEFIELMDRIHRYLSNNRGARVIVTNRPDNFCHSCPHLDGETCMGMPSHSRSEIGDLPDSATLMDNRVFEILEITPEAVYVWGEILNKIEQNLLPVHMDYICGTCEWRESSHCERTFRLGG